MTDWKSALAGLGSSPDTSNESENKKAEKKEVARKKRAGVVYSTNSDFVYDDDQADECSTLPPHQQNLHLQMERAGRGDKTVTLVKGFVGNSDDLASLCKLLKQKCGVGGSVKDGEIIMQGDLRTKIAEVLRKENYKVKG
ncbi:MAG: translation initiation factor [Bacteroidales bacterium]|nr:translation initiation factor [Bacteroidales bacterium]